MTHWRRDIQTLVGILRDQATIITHLTLPLTREHEQMVKTICCLLEGFVEQRTQQPVYLDTIIIIIGETVLDINTQGIT